ncbi:MULTISPECIES: alpha-hydroxy acid oxidase [unclassified Microbacterium]|uniref:alpha-hydroxy acid oxidase n=1 Tax=unclassified Microbacterium TaxID=2609290 RepID=UPI00214B58EE|nr:MULTISPECIES: alpha-hydroxy acid oxidase [unclassified Microbacterium]MCR2810442.1 alpha-hydroxy-acid oxidizing protein [Microbacterium sp. zg.B185]WIM18494.1 alpha-hydroxy acid oxidase [Microbacterium sp. zg-B185]
MSPRRAVPSIREVARMVRLGEGPPRRSVRSAADIADLRERARRRLPGPVFDYLDGAAGNEVASVRNRDAFDRVRLVSRVLRDVSVVDTTTDMLGRPAAAPVILGPIGLTRVFHPEGEAAVARVAAAHGIPAALSTMASTSPEAFAQAAPALDRWFQLYLWRDRGAARTIIERARRAGFRVLMLTVDVPVAGERLRDVRAGLQFPPSVPLRTAIGFARHPRWVWRVLTSEPIGFATGGGPRGDFVAQTNALLDPAVTFRDLEWLRSLWEGPIVVKGVLSPADAVALREHGMDGLVVSNHGGRQLEGAIAPAEALPAIRAAVGPDMFVAVDGGIRSGAHVAAALALGADAALIGRAYLYGLAAGGEAGVDQALRILESGLRRTLALLGAASTGEVTGGMARVDSRLRTPAEGHQSRFGVRSSG